MCIDVWRPQPEPVTAASVAAARAYLAGAASSFGARPDRALEAALDQIPDDRRANVVLLFDDGYSAVDAEMVAARNVHRAGVFPVAIGDQVFRPRLEILASRNYGFVTYLASADPGPGIQRLVEKLSRPVLTNTAIEFGKADLSQIYPEQFPALYAGAYQYTTGRYGLPGNAGFTITGLSSSGLQVIEGQLDFASRRNRNHFVRALWAQTRIDRLEWEMALSGAVDPQMRKEVVALSRTYGLRTRFTSFVADYETLYVPEQEDDELALTAGDYLAGLEVSLDATAVTCPSGPAPTDQAPVNPALVSEPPSPAWLAAPFPNPFNASTVVRLYVQPQAAGLVMLLKVYDCLGRLVAVRDLTSLAAGWHAVELLAVDHYGQLLASGVYLVQLEVAGRVVGQQRITVLR